MASDASANSFFPPVPGFDFLQGLVKKNAGVGLPGIGQWVAPTLNPEEVEKRIEELKTVQFWLEQNVRMLGATIQALEVQRMTLSTLQGMNVRMTDLRDALTARAPEGGNAGAAKPTGAAAAEAKPKSVYSMPSMFTAAPPSGAGAAPAAKAEAAAPAKGAAPADTPDAGAAPAGSVDAMQWWNALTQQFADLASSALRDTAASAQKLAAGGAKAPNDAAATAPPSGQRGSPT